MSIHVTTLGNAIVDVIARVEEEFLVTHRIAKGGMTLIDEARAATLTEAVGATQRCSGGSAANTAAGLALLGSHVRYLGKVRDDALGDAFRSDMQKIGVAFETPSATAGPATARCIVLVTPDGERTMNTYLGACSQVSETDIGEDAGGAQVLYVEGYLWDQPEAKAAIRKAFSLAKHAGQKTAFTLSDAFCVDRHRKEFLALLPGIDILFANETELLSLFETSDFDTALGFARGRAAITTVTRGEKGAVVLTKDETLFVPTAPVAQPVDTTGAGDLYASGFLHGLTHGMDMQACAALGNACARAVIQQIGARLPESARATLGMAA